MNFDIIPARAADAPFIASAVMAAVGHEICLGFAGSEDRIPLVRDTFTRLAAMDDTQYSYRNSLVALDTERNVAGVIVSYDGAMLHPMRERFIEVANEVLGLEIKAEEMQDETSPDEIYLDTLCVFEPYRRQGLAHKLIQAAVERHNTSEKPVGLLVDYDNPNARALYASIGFKPVGERPFAGVMMEHMQIGK